MPRKLIDFGEVIGSIKTPDKYRTEGSFRFISEKGGAVIQIEGDAKMKLLRETLLEAYPVGKTAAPLAHAGSVFDSIEKIVKGLITLADEMRWPESLRETLTHLNNMAVEEQERIRVALGGEP